MDAGMELLLAPVTREQARLFAGVARMLDRRGVACRFAVPSAEIGEELADEWGPLVHAQGAGNREHGTAEGGEHNGRGARPSIGAYDAWRWGWDEARRAETAGPAVEFWSGLVSGDAPRAVILWNGRDHVFVEAAAHIAAERGIDVLYMELGPLRHAPMTVAVARGGVNAAARWRRSEMLDEPLNAWEAERLERFVAGFRGQLVSRVQSRAYAFLPLQVDDDTQLFYYAPPFRDQRDMLQAVVAAMPSELPLVIKPHPLSDDRLGRARYAPLLRAIDQIAPAAAETLSLIAGARFIITSNSSAGVEGLMFDRPVAVLGEAHYRGKGFTCDFAGDMTRTLEAAASWRWSAERTARRDRYLFELAFHELVHLEHHPLRERLSEQECDRLAVRLCDLLAPLELGSDWTPLFREAAALRTQLREALDACAAGPEAIIIASRFAVACLDGSDPRITVLEDIGGKNGRRWQGRAVHLLAPDLSAGQRAAFVAQARNDGAAEVVDVVHAMSRLRCEHHTARFNQLPADIRNPLYSRSDYWDYYTGHIGPAGEEAGMLKRTQAELIVEALDSPAPASVLEYGCGDGVVLGGLLQRDPAIGAKRLAGVDSSGRMLDMARHRLRQGGRVELAPADARSAPLPFADRAFDAAYTCGALQHVPAAELPPILDELQRVARRKLVHWECFEAHRPTDGEHYTNPDTSRTIHESLLRRIGPVRMAVRDLRPISGQNSLLTSYELDRPLLTVLTFHAVGRPDPACESLDYRGMFVTPEELAQIVRVLRQGGWSFLTISQVQACARGERATPHKAVALTFDDGYESVFLDALPVLSQHGIKATAYITSDHISSRFSGATREGGGPPLPVMTEAQIRELADAGWDIGAHSCSHPVFLTLTPEQARREMTDSKARLEAITGRAVTSFAFPYGEPGVAFAPEQIDIARRVGFQTVMTMQPGLVDPAVNRPAWPRIGVGGDVWPEGLPARIAAIHRESSGWPATAPEPRQVLASRVRQVVRRCVQSGRTRVALYGAGRHTARLLSQTPLWPLQVVGLIDDDPSLAGTRRYGMPIYAPSDIASIRPEALVISSDQYEDAIYARLAPLESQGVSVHRLYGD